MKLFSIQKSGVFPKKMKQNRMHFENNQRGKRPLVHLSEVSEQEREQRHLPPSASTLTPY